MCPDGPADSAGAPTPDRLGRSSGLFRGQLLWLLKGFPVGSVIKKRRKRMAKKKHRKLLKKTRVQRRKLGK
jgi:hypothetical protein